MSRVLMMQGRLLPHSLDRYQVFPEERWRREIEEADALGYDGLELLVDRERVCNRIMASVKRTLPKYVFPSACLDILAHVGPVGSVEFERALNECGELCESLEVEVWVLPLVEANAPKDQRELVCYLSVVEDCLGSSTDKVAIECDLPVDSLLAALGESAFGLCYDIGNARARGARPESELPMLGDKLKHIHIKDRIVGGPNVPLGTGAVDLAAVGDSLRAIQYQGFLACETAYGEDPLESAKVNRELIRSNLGV